MARQGVGNCGWLVVGWDGNGKGAEAAGEGVKAAANARNASWAAALLGSGRGSPGQRLSWAATLLGSGVGQRGVAQRWVVRRRRVMRRRVGKYRPAAADPAPRRAAKLTHES